MSDEPGRLAGKRVLFITKHRSVQDEATGQVYGGMSSGLLNSARFVAEMLGRHGAEARVVQVVDNNGIDREVHQFKPEIVVVEALWVVPEKFAVLTKLHPSVKWVVRLHSDFPFLSNEGSALDWLSHYLDYPGVHINANSISTKDSLQFLLEARYRNVDTVQVSERLSYLPNYYPVDWKAKREKIEDPEFIDIASPGAVRPMKGHLNQAVAAIKFAEDLGRTLRFHINSGRVEGRGEPVQKNLRNLFANQSRHQLVEHSWAPHEDFLKVVAQMDIGMQVSFSETFCIVAADFVNLNVPVVVSDEIDWVSQLFWADPNDVESQVRKLKVAWYGRHLNLQALNKFGLDRYAEQSEIRWCDFVARS